METSLPFSKKRSRFILLAPLIFVLLTMGAFNLFQQPIIYNATINKIGFTYLRINNPDGSRKEVKKIKDVPFQKINNEKLTHWDALIYLNLSKDLYRKDAPDKFAFFPMFPVLWKLSHLPINAIVYLNILLFLVGYIFMYFIIRDYFKFSDKNVQHIYLLLLAIPSLVVFAIPYAEATAFIIFSLAIYFLILEKKLFTFIMFFLLALCRPNTLLLLISSFSAIAIIIFQPGKVKNKRSIFSAVGGLLTGLISLFTYYYLISDNFWIFFEAQKNWGTQLQWPHLPFTDYAAEVMLINRLLLFVLMPASIIKLIQTVFFDKKETGTWYYVKVFSNIYFLATVLSVVLFQGGSLHSLHRYLFATPLGMIFLIDLCTSFIHANILKKWIVFSVFIIGCSLCVHLTDPELLGQIIRNKNEQLFTNIGVGIFVIVTCLLFWIPVKDSRWSKAYLPAVIIVLMIALVWDSVLFNQFLSRGWLWA